MDNVEKTEVVEGVEVTEEPKITFNPKKIETSKIVLIVVLLVCFIFSIFILYGWFIGLHEAPALLGIVNSAAGIVLTNYSIKSKKENEIKLRHIYGKLHVSEHEQNQNYGGFGGYNSFQNTMPYGNHFNNNDNFG